MWLLGFTLDDDFIVPDTMDDMEQVMLDDGEIQAEQVKPMGDKVNVKGRLEFGFCTAGRQLQTLGGSIPFEEMINVPQLEDKDTVSLSWTLDDLDPEYDPFPKTGSSGDSYPSSAD